MVFLYDLARAVWVVARASCSQCPEAGLPRDEQCVRLLLTWIGGMGGEAEDLLVATLAVAAKTHPHGPCCQMGLRREGRPAAAKPAPKPLAAAYSDTDCSTTASGTPGGEDASPPPTCDVVKSTIMRTSGAILNMAFSRLSSISQKSRCATAAVRVRDCGAVLAILESFCVCLYVASAWLFEDGVSSVVLARVLHAASRELRAHRACNAPLGGESKSMLAERAAAQLRRFATPMCLSLVPAAPPCALCSRKPHNDLNESLVEFQNKVYQFLANVDYNTRIHDDDLRAVRDKLLNFFG